MTADDLDVRTRLASLERDRRKLQTTVYAQVFVTLILAAFLITSCSFTAQTEVADEPRALTVSELNVVDAAGVVRIRVGTDLPDAVIDGKRIPRGGEASGVMLYDETGQERGGYVTMEGNIMLTLDARFGQVALFAAGPEGGSTVRLWHEDDAIELRSGPSGARITAVRGGEVVLQEPAIDINAEACTAYREALEERSREEVEAVCRQRFRKQACARCLAGG